MGKARFWITVSASLMAGSILAIIFIGPRYGIDFAGGTEVQVAFKQKVDSAKVRSTMEKIGLPASEVVTFGAGESEFLIRLQTISPIDKKMEVAAKDKLATILSGNTLSRFELSPGGDKLLIYLNKEIPIPEVEKAVKESGLGLGSRDEGPTEIRKVEDGEEEEAEAETAKRCESISCTWPQLGIQVYEVNLEGVAEKVMQGLRAQPFGKDVVKMRSEWVGPKVGEQLRSAGIASVLYAMLFIMIYIAVRFDIRFGPGGVIALFHDALITTGVFVVLGLEINMNFLAAILTIVGYSINDTIVTYDRIREIMSKTKDGKIEPIINRAVNETLSRTILTSLTVMLAVVAMLIIGWNTSIRDFCLAMAVGVIIGCYSTIFIASPMTVLLSKISSKKKA